MHASAVQLEHPYPECNISETLKLPEGFKIDFDKDGSRH
jgi:hypothetical protein